mmetsp:Transcript_657/g.1163  ORF Transcript_657/g.1163 Transcript_657/m.1163 type:complete len:413 (-) Transcript_657:911-2149(-)
MLAHISRTPASPCWHTLSGPIASHLRHAARLECMHLSSKFQECGSLICTSSPRRFRLSGAGVAKLQCCRLQRRRVRGGPQWVRWQWPRRVPGIRLSVLPKSLRPGNLQRRRWQRARRAEQPAAGRGMRRPFSAESWWPVPDLLFSTGAHRLRCWLWDATNSAACSTALTALRRQRLCHYIRPAANSKAHWLLTQLLVTGSARYARAKQPQARLGRFGVPAKSGLQGVLQGRQPLLSLLHMPVLLRDGALQRSRGMATFQQLCLQGAALPAQGGLCEGQLRFLHLALASALEISCERCRGQAIVKSIAAAVSGPCAARGCHGSFLLQLSELCRYASEVRRQMQQRFLSSRELLGIGFCGARSLGSCRRLCRRCCSCHRVSEGSTQSPHASAPGMQLTASLQQTQDALLECHGQ